MKDDTEALVLIAVAGMVIYAVYTGVGKAGSAAGAAAAQAGSDAYDSLGLTSLDNWINNALGLPATEVAGQSSFTANTSSALNGLGAGVVIVKLPSGALISIANSNVNSKGQFTYKGQAYQAYVGPNSTLTAVPA